MPVAKGKGGKKRRRGKNIVEENTGLLKFEPGQAYGRIVKLLGNGRANVECYIWEKNKETNKMEMNLRTCVGKIRGKLMKRMWMGNDDIVLVGLRDFQDDRVDIIHKYSYNEIIDGLSGQADLINTIEQKDNSIRTPPLVTSRLKPTL